MGSLRKRGDKWYYSFEVGTVEGKRKRVERVGGRTKKEAAAALRKAEEEFEKGGVIQRSNNFTVAQYLDKWLYEDYQNKIKYRTLQEKESIIKNHINPEIGHLKLNKIKHMHLQNLIDKKIKEGYSKVYINNIMGTLKVAFKYATSKYEILYKNPADALENTSKDRRKDMYIITPDIFEKIMTFFPFGNDYRLAVMIGYHTGLRLSEITSLSWNDIDLNNKTLSVNYSMFNKKKTWYLGSPKTEASKRTISIGEILLSELKKQKVLQAENKLKYGKHYAKFHLEKTKINKDDCWEIFPGEGDISFEPVCCRNYGDFMTKHKLRIAKDKLQREVDPRFHFHALRDSHATLLVESGASPKFVQKRLGHTKVETTLNLYVGVTEELEKETIENLDRYLSTL